MAYTLITANRNYSSWSLRPWLLMRALGIALYVAERHPGVWPADEAARAWAFCAVAEMHGGFGALRRERTMTVGQRIRPTRGSEALARDVARISELWDEGLSRFGGPWLAGERFTAVDAFYAPVAFRVRAWGIDVGAAGARWVETLLAHPATREWEAAALAETFREEGHEAEVAAYGEVIEDLRATA